MKINLSAWLFSFLLLIGCSPAKQIEKRYTADDKTVFELLDRLKKNANDQEAAKLLPEAYSRAAEARKNINSNSYANMSDGDRWIEISKQLLVADQLYQEIKNNPTISKIIPDPWNPALKIQEAKINAAEEYYNQGQEYLSYNNRPYAQKAYDEFIKASKAAPDYRDVKNMIDLALEKATIKVVVRPVNYYNNSWNYWGFNNDYLQYRMVNDLNSASYQTVRFFTDDDASRLHIRPDRIVELNFTELYIGQLYSDNYSISRSRQIETGQTKTTPPRPIYETVYATVYVSRQVLQNRALLESRIYDWATGRIILSDRFPDTYTWRQERARFTGDRRALEPSDWVLINNNAGSFPPSRNEIAQRLISNSYNSLLTRIRNGVTFGD